MLNKLLLATVVVSSLSACAGKTEKVRLEGERIIIKPQQTMLVPDAALAKMQVLLPKQLAYQDWTQEGGFPDHAPLHPKIDTEVKKAWKKSVGSSLDDYQSFSSSPIIFNNVLYTINTDHEIIALNSKTGKKLWELELESELEDGEIITPGSLAIEGTNLIAVLSSGELYSISLVTKKVLWKQNLSEAVRSAPTIKDGVVLINSLNNKLSVFDIANGNLLWTHTGLSESLTMLGDSSPAVADNIVVTTYSSGEIYALDLKTGGEIWSDNLDENNSFTQEEKILDVVASPVILGNLLYVVNYSGKLSTFSLKTGKKYWTRSVSSVTTPWATGNSIFIVSENGLLACIYHKTGQVKWIVNLNETMHKELKAKKRKNALFTAPFLAGNRIVVASNKGYIGGFNPYNGKMSAYLDVNESITTNPIVSSGTIYFLTDNANIIAYRKAK